MVPRLIHNGTMCVGIGKWNPRWSWKRAWGDGVLDVVWDPRRIPPTILPRRGWKDWKGALGAGMQRDWRRSPWRQWQTFAIGRGIKSGESRVVDER